MSRQETTADGIIANAIEAAIQVAWPGEEAIFDDAHAGPGSMLAAAISAFLRADGMDGLLCGAHSVASLLEAGGHE